MFVQLNKNHISLGKNITTGIQKLRCQSQYMILSVLYFATIHVLTHNSNRITVLIHDKFTILISKMCFAIHLFLHFFFQKNFTSPEFGIRDIDTIGDH